ncbi:MAG: hypothetical protein PUB42_00110 [Firmicutes bacterium]|nr:hypothetical protein [Bacillota bacterium]
MYPYIKDCNEQPTSKVLDLTNATKTAKGVPELSLDYDLQMAMYDSCQKYDVPFVLALDVAEKERKAALTCMQRARQTITALLQINRCNFEYLRNKEIYPLT